MNPTVNAIANRLSLRQPQRDSLEILARVCDIISLEKGADPAAALEAIKAEFPSVTDFERDFPSLCFALATGVGKTRLMGAFISYLYRAENIRHYFVLAPNLTIYNKLIADFTPNTPKYVFQGIAEFALNPPEIITGDNYGSGRGVRSSDLLDTSHIHINIFNISKINSEVRGDRAPRIKRLSEYIGESYFEYLSKLDDLVLLMDESHRYRASAGVKAINELKPILGLELTATPQIEKGNTAESFKNVIYSYPLFKAMEDGFVKEPAVATRENFDAANYNPESLERLKLEDGIHVHENVKTRLEIYARENGREIVKPFMLVVAADTAHANAILQTMEGDDFFQGRYKGKAITVHSNLRGEEKDETVQQLLTVENRDNPTEIVIHVNMLKEGWDVTNLYTIVPLRAANSKTLVEQSIGRGLRLPYGKRTGVMDVDRLTIVSHDKFQEIVDEARRGNSIIRAGVVIGRDIPTERQIAVVIPSNLEMAITGAPAPAGLTVRPMGNLFETPQQRRAGQAALEIIGQLERQGHPPDLNNADVLADLARKVAVAMTPAQGELIGVLEPMDIGHVVETTVALCREMSIQIPRIMLLPKGDVTAGYRDFDLDTSSVHLQPVAKDILIQHLRDSTQHRLVSGDGTVEEHRLEDYLVFGLIDYNDICYDQHSTLLYKLSGQMVEHLKSYLKDDDAVRNVLQYHRRMLVELIHTQMQEHFYQNHAGFDVHTAAGYTTLRPGNYSMAAGETVRNFRDTVEQRILIRGMLFGGFSKCLYPAQKFHTDTERKFSVVLENDKEVQKWFKPNRSDFQIHLPGGASYEPDFVVETRTTKLICEPKAANEMDSVDVTTKASAATQWCQYATQHEGKNGGKPWTYLLIPHDAISENKTLAGLAAAYTYRDTSGNQQ
ncbi:MAG: DEAD/DEAH box helicase family protein [Phycisphaerae bacterium]